MKRLSALYLAFLLLLTLAVTPALASQQITILHSIPEAGVTMQLPADWETVTRQTPEDDPIFHGEGWDYQTWQDYLFSYDIYLDCTNPDPAVYQYITVYWLEGYDNHEPGYHTLDRNALVEIAAYRLENGQDYGYDRYEIYRDTGNNNLTFLVYHGSYTEEDGTAYAFTEYETSYDGGFLQIELYGDASPAYESALPLLRAAVESIRFRDGRLATDASAATTPLSGGSTGANDEILRLGPSRNPIVTYVDSYESGGMIRKTNPSGLLNAVIAYAYLILAFLAWRLLCKLLQKLLRLDSTGKRRQRYHDKLKQAEEQSARIDLYKFLYYLVLPYCLLVYPWLAVRRFLPLVAGWSALLANADLRNLLLSALVLWLLLYYTRRRMQCFSRWSLPMLLLCLICYVAEKLLLYGEFISYFWLGIYGLLALLLTVYFLKRRQLFGPLPAARPTGPAPNPTTENHDTIE